MKVKGRFLYVLILVLMILLVIITFYLYHQRIRELDSAFPQLGFVE